MRKVRKILGRINIFSILFVFIISMYQYFIFPMTDFYQLKEEKLEAFKIPSGNKTLHFTLKDIEIRPLKNKQPIFLTIRNKETGKLENYYRLKLNNENISNYNLDESLVFKITRGSELKSYSPNIKEESKEIKKDYHSTLKEYLGIENKIKQYNQQYNTELRLEYLKVEEAYLSTDISKRLTFITSLLYNTIVGVSISLLIINFILNQVEGGKNGVRNKRNHSNKRNKGTRKGNGYNTRHRRKSFPHKL